MLNKPYFTKNNRISLVCNGDEFIETCCTLVSEAKQKILFHTYAFEADEVTQPFIEALLKKAQQGVHVFMMIDAIGSNEIPSELKRKLAESRIHFCYFSPIVSRRLENVGRRMHQKVLVIDNDKALIGGINHGKHFIKPPDRDPWLDYAALVEGEEVYRLQCKIQRFYARYFPEDWPLLRSLIQEHSSPPCSFVRVRTNVNDFMRFRSEIYRSHIRGVRRAKQSIQILATYFLPGKKLLKELKRAARRGVKVELIFSKLSDHPTERWSSKYLYSWYLENGIHIYEWDKSIIHGKVTLVDDQWVTLGSYNHNHLSRYINAELNLEVLDKPFARSVGSELSRIKSQCREIDVQAWREGTTVLQSLLYFSTYALASFMTLVSALIIIRKKEPKFTE
jgi:cardiolipin synthase